MKKAAFLLLILLPACNPRPDYDSGEWQVLHKTHAAVWNPIRDSLQVQCKKNQGWYLSAQIQNTRYEAGGLHAFQLENARQPDTRIPVEFRANNCGMLFSPAPAGAFRILRDAGTVRLIHAQTGRSYVFPMAEFETAYQKLAAHCGGPEDLR